MKKLLLSGLALTVCLSAFAQNSNREIQSRLNEAIRNKTITATKPTDTPVLPTRGVNPTVYQSRSSMVETVIGQTTYDLQSNYGSVGNRVKLWDDNTISATWTKGDDAAGGYPDRGTGYNYYDGSSWGPAPTARIDAIRTGWPNVSGTNSSGEIVVNHTPTTMVSRPNKGTGTWTTTSPLGNLAVTWPRFVVGGANGNTIHVIGNENTGNFNMTYSRSVDGGVTWADENILLPDFLTLHFEGSVDAYDIDARGDVVAIIMGGWNESLTLWKSFDNGSTWNHTTINEFPLAPWDYVNTTSDVDGDGVPDTVNTVDGGMSVVIDNFNTVHVAVGSMRVLGSTAGSYSYFPGTDGLLYWNETLPAGDITNNIIAFIDDIDNSGVIEIAPSIALYQASLTGMPTMGVDAMNNIHIAYSSIIENTTNGNPVVDCEESFRNVYHMYTTDYGANWSTPTRIEGSDFDEMAWPSMAKRVNGCVHLTYFKDGEPGNTFQPQTGNCDSPAPYDVIYVCVENPVGLNDINNDVASISIYPNPVASILNLDYTLNETQKTTIQVVDVLGKVVYTTTQMGVKGINTLKVNVKDYASGLYSLNILTGNSVKSQKVVIK